ncbi:hypothetical protein IEQ34_017389 [Dendrobium chrysotoxum]|uniref:Uncharacterized protein n=1 Tax=Dendrobium chrysotoxum TaxID=161865 RepID=A0AAV7GBE3_DENCH|nr:hypothetical protein IEQ34_017389 [Dendrobium chrysotoxum]
MRTRDPTKGWSSVFFFVRNDWGLLDKGLVSSFARRRGGHNEAYEGPQRRASSIRVHRRRVHVQGWSVLSPREIGCSDEAALTGFESSRVIEDFKKSITFKIIIQDHVQEARDHIYEVEVKALEQQCLDEGFIRGFLKGVHLVQRKAGVEVEGLTPSHASDDFPLDSDGYEVESELQKAFTLEVYDEIVDIE